LTALARREREPRSPRCLHADVKYAQVVDGRLLAQQSLGGHPVTDDLCPGQFHQWIAGLSNAWQIVSW
jgi:hypothetical protein